MNANLTDLMTGAQGWLSTKEGLYLCDRAREVTDGCIVEIGTFKGKSTIALATGAPDGVTVYAIDPHEAHTDEVGGQFGPADRVIFCEQILHAHVAHKIAPINLHSWAVAHIWREDIGLLFIDGAHNYADVYADFYDWQEFIVPGGLVLFHDSSWPDIQKVIEDVRGQPEWRFVHQYESMSVFQRD